MPFMPQWGCLGPTFRWVSPRQLLFYRLICLVFFSQDYLILYEASASNIPFFVNLKYYFCIQSKSVVEYKTLQVHHEGRSPSILSAQGRPALCLHCSCLTSSILSDQFNSYWLLLARTSVLCYQCLNVMVSADLWHFVFGYCSRANPLFPQNIQSSILRVQCNLFQLFGKNLELVLLPAHNLFYLKLNRVPVISSPSKFSLFFLLFSSFCAQHPFTV